MGLNANATVIPGKGTVFLAPPNTAPFTRALTASLDPGIPSTHTGWDTFGHTSRDNNVSLSKEGGDATNLGSWWDPSLVSNRDATSWGLTVNSLQMDYLTFSTALPNGRVTPDGGWVVGSDAGSVERAVFVLMVDGTKRMGIYGPRVNLSIGDAPSIATDGFFEIAMSGSMLSATAAAAPNIQIGDLIYFVPPVALVPLDGRGAAANNATFTDLNITASDVTNAGKLAGLGFVASPLTVWTTGQKITVSGYQFHWTGTAWAAGAKT